MRKVNKQKGFTLMELLIVVMLVGLLAFVMISESNDRDTCKEAGGTFLNGHYVNHCLAIVDGKIVGIE